MENKTPNRRGQAHGTSNIVRSHGIHSYEGYLLARMRRGHSLNWKPQPYRWSGKNKMRGIALAKMQCSFPSSESTQERGACPGCRRSNYDSTKVCFACLDFSPRGLPRDFAGDPPSPSSGVAGRPATTVDESHFFLWPTISPRSVRRSTRVRFLSIAGVSNEICGISQRYSAMNHIGFSVVIQCR